MNIAFRLYFFLLFSSCLLAQSETNQQLQAWMEYSSPGPMHQVLSKTVGDWDVTIKLWNDINQSEPTFSQGSAKTELILGERFVKMTFKARLMGTEVEGFSIDGYDNAKQEFQNVWIDNTGTGIVQSTGKYDEVNNKIDYIGKLYDPSIKQDVEFRSIMKFYSGDRMVFRMYSKVDGKEFLTMELAYSRKK